MLEVEIPVSLVLAKKYMQLKSYFDDFVDKLEESGEDLKDDKYVVVVYLEKKLDRNDF